MNKILNTILVFTCLTSCNKEAFKWTSDYDVSIMSFNVRYDEIADGEHKWDNRKEAVVNMWEITRPSVVGIQEGLYHQVEYLERELTDYDYVGVGRDDGHSSGEYAAIFYLKDKYEVVEKGDFWLSETPDVPSLGWDANNIRIVTWVKLKDVHSNQIFYMFNTHFDHKGKKARKESPKLLVNKIKTIVSEEVPIFITGDLNTWINNSNLRPITNEYYDARRFADYSDNKKSFNYWGKWYANWNIDYIFYKNANALAFRTVTEDFGVPFISDHYPIITHFNYSN